jgi:hypothetical protein
MRNEFSVFSFQRSHAFHLKTENYLSLIIPHSSFPSTAGRHAADPASEYFPLPGLLEKPAIQKGDVFNLLPHVRIRSSKMRDKL